MRVPSFMLKKLYVPGSLKPVRGGGFRFKLKNTLATATLVSPPEIEVDGELIGVKNIVFSVGGEEVRGQTMSDAKPFRLEKGVEVDVESARPALDKGPHKLHIKVNSKEWETLDFEVEDSL